jgi:ATP/maltotriose-dependent transcriptional regulator MalT
LWVLAASSRSAPNHEGLELQQSGSEKRHQPGTLIALARAQAGVGRLDEGLATLSETSRRVEQTEERLWGAELHLLTAEFQLTQNDVTGAETSLHKALEVARRRQAKSWQLRAATRLARLRKARGETDEARLMLAEVYVRFTEGFDTPDLQRARVLLETLQ